MFRVVQSPLKCCKSPHHAKIEAFVGGKVIFACSEQLRPPNRKAHFSAIGTHHIRLSSRSHSFTPRCPDLLEKPGLGFIKNDPSLRQKYRRQISSMSAPPGLHRAIVAFGGNVGNTVAHIENALESLRQNGIRIVKLSKLYRTQPMYVEDQASFLNGVGLVETHLAPIELLDLLQKVENEEGRVRKIAKGPRTLDLDIILYGSEHVNVERLQVPHPLMMEREFVLRPLAE